MNENTTQENTIKLYWQVVEERNDLRTQCWAAQTHVKESDIVMARMFNAIWQDYKLFEVYNAWRESCPNMDKDFIITDKCGGKLPPNMQYAFRSLYQQMTYGGQK